MTPTNRIQLWDLINEYASTCGGDPSRSGPRPGRRESLVAEIEQLIRTIESDTSGPPGCAVTLRFKTPRAKQYFMGQLSDGWGENVCGLKWDHSVKFDKCSVFHVEPWDPDDEVVE